MAKGLPKALPRLVGTRLDGDGGAEARLLLAPNAPRSARTDSVVRFLGEVVADGDDC